MFWNKKDDKGGLPDLPPLKTPLKPAFDFPEEPRRGIDDLDEEVVEKHGLPSFPDSPMQRGFSQAAIKEAIVQEQIPEEHQETPVSPSAIKTTELDSSMPMQKQKFTLEEPPTERIISAPKKPAQKPNETFVKVERFNAAHRSLTTIRKKIDELDNSLRKIREVKLREEQELSSWEKEVASLKSRLQEVNDSLFD
ncbi:MAG TPA: hypothetical protein VHA12_02310 [Candidatus Nanoarchaeia archaeon]|nr:hypothetical protein [Candidatus Nanoarchaeia archaeon]